ncbi:MAG TPA: CotH kinase family protein [Verrucomicrobiota bacterium]|nr:CotH kinase family protein [Verrucomicrobiota bacterium]
MFSPVFRSLPGVVNTNGLQARPSLARCCLLRCITLLLFGCVVCGPFASAVPSADPTDKFYASESLQTIRLEISPENLDRLQRALPRRISVPGTFQWNDQTLQSVGIRYKGNSSSDPNSPHKRSFLITFSEYQTGQRFLGLQHVALDNGIQFGGLFSERLITDVLRGVGVKASRCNYARVYLNGKPAGVYVNVERIDRTFLERNFDSSGGALFKVDEGGPGAELHYLGSDVALYRKAFELHAGNEVEAFAALLEFIRAIDPSTGDGTELSRALDVDAFLKTTAVLLLAGAFDQYTGWGPHNYYLYQNPADHRWTYIPWDLDVGFADNAFGRVPVLEGWNAAWPAPVPDRPLMERLISDPVLLQRYRQHARTILETWFRPEILIPKLHKLHAQIRLALEEDPFPSRRATVPTDRGIEDIFMSMEKFIRDRYALARVQLDAPGNRPVPKPMAPQPQPQGPMPGPPSADAPTDLRAAKVTAEGVELQWVDHAEGEVAHVVQRCSGVDCTDFVNALGLEGPHVTTAMDRQVQGGKTYRYRVYAVLPTPGGPRGTGVSNVITVTVPER